MSRDKYRPQNSIKHLSNQVLSIMVNPSFEELGQIDSIHELDRYLAYMECTCESDLDMEGE